MKKLGILALMIAMTIGLVGVVHATNPTLTINTPTTGGYIRGSTQLLNVTVGATVVANNTNNCTNVTWTRGSVVIGSNVSGADFGFNNTDVLFAYDTGGLSDDTTYTITATCYNSSTGGIGADGTSVGSDSETGLIPDNTVPICTHSLSSSSSYAPTQTWTVTATNASSCTLRFGSNQPLTMTESSDSCTYTGNVNTIPEGIYTVTARTSDGTNTTDCILTDVRIDSDATILKVAAVLAQSNLKKTSGGETNPLLIVGIAIVGFIIAKKQKWI